MNRNTAIDFYALGTKNSIRAYGSGGSGALRAACRRVRAIDRAMSAFRPGSDVWRLNESAGCGPVRLGTETIDVLARAQEYAALTGGAFDCTVRPLTRLWGIGGECERVPSVREISDTLPNAGYKGLAVNRDNLTAELARKGMAVDLGGIAKGYAADEIKRLLAEAGILSAIINLGGNIVAMGRRGDGRPWRIGVQDPLALTGKPLAVLEVEDRTVVTSGSYERFFIRDGVRYHHIIDPRTGSPAASGLLSVTVVGASSIDADALTTALFVLGRDKGLELLRMLNADAVFISEDSELTVTDGLRGTIVKCSDKEA